MKMTRRPHDPADPRDQHQQPATMHDQYQQPASMFGQYIDGQARRPSWTRAKNVGGATADAVRPQVVPPTRESNTRAAA